MTDSHKDTIPNIYHFIWIGKEVPYFLILAIKSVLVRCPNSSVFLWVEGLKAYSSEVNELLNIDGFEVKEIDITEMINSLEEVNQKELIEEAFKIAGTKSRLTKTNPFERTRSNLIRYLILIKFGGVYIDADTLVLKDLSKLNKRSTGYIGKENSIWPILLRSNPLHRFIWAPFLEVYRFLANTFPGGYKLNNNFKHLCGASENNAIIGLTPSHPFLKMCFDYITKMPIKEITKPLRLGPYLFQRVVKQYPEIDIKIYPEKYFYPYGPLISQHFFRKRKNAQSVLEYMISDETYIIHWGASTKELNNYRLEDTTKSDTRSVFDLLAAEVTSAFEEKYDL